MELPGIDSSSQLQPDNADHVNNSADNSTKHQASGITSHDDVESGAANGEEDEMEFPEGESQYHFSIFECL